MLPVVPCLIELVDCRSRLGLMKGINELQGQVQEQEDKVSKLESQATDVENSLNAILTEMERLRPKRLHLRCAAVGQLHLAIECAACLLCFIVKM